MSPSVALASPVFRFYVALGAALLLGAGAVLAILRFGLGKNVEHAWKAYVGWLIMIPLGLGVIFLGREATIAFLTVLAIFGFKEFARATGLYIDWWMTGAVYVGILAVGAVSLVYDPVRHVPGWYGLYMALPVYAIAALLVIPIARNQPQGQVQTLALSIVGFIYLGWMFGHLAFLANSRHAYSYVLYVLFAVEIADVSAYTFGKLFGAHPLRSNISPSNTWEGALARSWCRWPCRGRSTSRFPTSRPGNASCWERSWAWAPSLAT